MSDEPEAGGPDINGDDTTTVDHQLQFHYIKSQHFRVVHVDGGVGGLTPRGQNFHIALYNERFAIPRLGARPVDAEGRVTGDEEFIEGREGVVRELEVDLIFNRITALELHQWLTRWLVQAGIIEEPQKNGSGST